MESTEGIFLEEIEWLEIKRLEIRRLGDYRHVNLLISQSPVFYILTTSSIAKSVSPRLALIVGFKSAIEGAQYGPDRSNFDAGIDARAKEALTRGCLDLNVGNRFGGCTLAEGVFGVIE